MPLRTSKTTLFPFIMDGQRLGVRPNLPVLGAHTDELLGALAVNANEVRELRVQKAVGE